jgi:hypothetical protein
MTTLNTFQSIPLTVAPLDEVNLNLSGRYVACLESDLEFFELGVDGTAKQRMEPGLQLLTRDGEEFNSLQVRNPDTTFDLTLRLAVGSGEVRDNRFSAGAFNLARALNFITNTKADIAAGAETTLYSPQPDDQEVLLKADPLNLREVWLKTNIGAGFDPSRYPLWPGEELRVRMRAGGNIRAKNPSGGATATIYILKMQGAE